MNLTKGPMKFHFYVVVGWCVLVMLGVGQAWGQEENNSQKSRLDKLEKENQQLREMIEQLQNRLEALESIEAKDKKKPKDKVEIEQVEAEEVKEEEEEEEEPSNWIPSMEEEEFQLGGRLQFEYFKREDEDLLRSAFPENPGGSFHIDEVRLSVDADFKNDFRFHSDIDIVNENDGSRIVEAYIDIEDLPLSSELRVGLQKPIYRPSRHTETYPLPGTAFWRARDLGISLKNEYGLLYTYLAVSNGLELDDRSLGEDDSAPTIGVDESRIDLNGDKEVSGGVGVEYDFDPYGDIEVMVFGLTGGLDDDDVLFLQNEVPGYGFSSSNNRDLVGVNVEYDIGEWDFFAQGIKGRDGDLERTGWYAVVSRKFEFKGLRYLDELRPLIRYGELDNNLAKRPFANEGSLTWDRKQWLFAIIAELTRNVTFRAEYALNDEDTGGSDVQDNEMLFQLEVLF